MLPHNEILYVDKLISASTFIILIIENCSRIIGIVIEFIILKPLIKFLNFNACMFSMIIFSNNMKERSVHLKNKK
jgi:presenilin-like A22 family membrane protease